MLRNEMTRIVFDLLLTPLLFARKSTTVFTLCAMFLALGDSIEAQSPLKVPRLGVLLYSKPDTDLNVAAFRQELRDLGYIEGQNLSIEYRFAEGKPERLPALASDLARVKPDAILALGGDVMSAAQTAIKAIPIVMWVSNDPVQAGLVASLARPGGNITGITLILDELAGKRLTLLKEVVPRVSRVGVLWNPEHADPEFRELQVAARAFNVRLQSFEVRQGEHFSSAFEAVEKAQSEAMIAVSSRLMQLHRKRVVDFAAKMQMPLVGDWGPWAPEGALLSYGPNLGEMARRVASLVDKVLKGTKPADLPVERPTRFELVINLKTAKQLGLTVPPDVLARADRVIK
jgi:putative ABC transport system substrate-binding protein